MRKHNGKGSRQKDTERNVHTIVGQKSQHY